MEMNEVDGFPCKAYFIAVILYPVCGNKINELKVLSQNYIVTYPCTVLSGYTEILELS